MCTASASTLLLVTNPPNAKPDSDFQVQHFFLFRSPRILSYLYLDESSNFRQIFAMLSVMSRRGQDFYCLEHFADFEVASKNTLLDLFAMLTNEDKRELFAVYFTVSVHA